MSKQAHTPTPWEVQDIESEGDERGEAFIIGVNLGGLVGAALPWPTETDSGDFSRVAANARLIVRAVNCHADLLSALKDLRALVRGEAPSLLNEDSGGDAELSLRIDAAIAKAEA